VRLRVHCRVGWLTPDRARRWLAPIRTLETVKHHVGQSTVSAHLKIPADVRSVLADRKGTSAYYRINEACVDCFPNTADLVMGKPAPRPAAATSQQGSNV
jgi:hypothetical protein